MTMVNEVRLIDANALIERLREAEAHKGMGSVIAGLLIRYIGKMPTIDPETLRPKGQWVVNRNSFDGYTHHRCSHCGTDAPFVYTYIDEWDEDLDGEWDYIGQRENGIEEQMGSFCPHCGADMRGETDVK